VNTYRSVVGANDRCMASAVSRVSAGGLLPLAPSGLRHDWVSGLGSDELTTCSPWQHR